MKKSRPCSRCGGWLDYYKCKFEYGDMLIMQHKIGCTKCNIYSIRCIDWENQMKKPKLCPKCHTKPDELFVIDTKHKIKFYYILCTGKECRTRSSWCLTPERARQDWNEKKPVHLLTVDEMPPYEHGAPKK